jgi:hypothetical protein
MKLYPTTLALAVLLSGPALGQQVTFRGQVEDVQGTQNQFFVDCTDISLTSAAFDLNLFVGEQTEITGLWNGSAAFPSVEVTAIETVAQSFSIGGGAKIGEKINFGVMGENGDIGVGFASAGPGFLPFAPHGVIQVDFANGFIVGSGTIFSAGDVEFEFSIPDNPALVGMEIWGQGAVIDPTTFAMVLTNSDCRAIED